MAPGDALTIGELGRRYLANLERQGRKKATTTAVGSILGEWLEPFFADRDLRRIAAEDVHDLMTMMQKGQRSGPRLEGDRRYGRALGANSIRNYIGVPHGDCSRSPSGRVGSPATSPGTSICRRRARERRDPVP